MESSAYYFAYLFGHNDRVRRREWLLLNFASRTNFGQSQNLKNHTHPMQRFIRLLMIIGFWTSFIFVDARTFLRNCPKIGLYPFSTLNIFSRHSASLVDSAYKTMPYRVLYGWHHDLYPPSVEFRFWCKREKISFNKCSILINDCLTASDFMYSLAPKSNFTP